MTARGRVTGIGVAAALAVVAVVAAGCVRVSRLSYPPAPPSPPSPATTTTTVPDLTGVTLPAVAGRTTTTVAMGPGGARLTGTVVGPAGPVAAAHVHVERLVGDGVATADVTANPDGTWALPGVLGGRYRVRAWRSPDLAETTPQIFWLAATDTWSATLRLEQFSRAQLTALVLPDPPVVGRPAALTVQLTTQQVDNLGVVRAQPVAAASVALAGGGSWTLAGPATAVTAGNGVVSWQLTCEAPGPQLLAATVNGTDTYPVDVSACVNPPPPPTTTSTAVPGATSTTAAPTGGPGTTTQGH